MTEQAAPADLSQPPPRSLRELIDRVTGRSFEVEKPVVDSGIAENIPYPFLAIVGQKEMKLALILGVINPAIGGVLLVGPRGTGKTTSVRSLVSLLPLVPRSLCFYGCMPEDIEAGGIDAVCEECAKKFANGESLTIPDQVRLVELPLNARLDDVVGGLDERALVQNRIRIRRGLLAQADRNILYVDEVNLLQDEVADALLDAAAQGLYTVRRGPLAATYRSRFVFIGSMNPEEGNLRPQIQDRFGLRVLIRGLSNQDERIEAYRRVRSYLVNSRAMVEAYSEETKFLQAEIHTARQLLQSVEIPGDVARWGLGLILQLKIDSLRAEITLFEAARAYAAADGRNLVDHQDIKTIAPLALRFRRSQFIMDYFEAQNRDDIELSGMIDSTNIS